MDDSGGDLASPSCTHPLKHVATVYALAISIFGGSTQSVVTWLLKITTATRWCWRGNDGGDGVFAVAAMILMPESAPVKTGARKSS